MDLALLVIAGYNLIPSLNVGELGSNICRPFIDKGNGPGTSGGSQTKWKEQLRWVKSKNHKNVKNIRTYVMDFKILVTNGDVGDGLR